MYGIVVLYSKLNSSIKSSRLTILHFNSASPNVPLQRVETGLMQDCMSTTKGGALGQSSAKTDFIQNVVEPKTCFFGKALLNLDRRQNLSILTTRKQNSPRKDSDSVTPNNITENRLRTAFFQRYSDILLSL